MNFSETILSWYYANKRELPWRDTKNPYLIWVSEVILQQTRVEQGLPYYHRFIQAFPSVTHLAKANEEQVLKLWQGLGYYSRARNMHAAAKFITENHKGEFPSAYEEIIKLKGIGRYTAAAIASFAYNKPYAVVDGNVYRLLARYFGISTPIDSLKGQKEFAALAQELIIKSKPADFNQAIMEFGAVQCAPKSPDCGKCPLNITCTVLKKGDISAYPVKGKKTKQKSRYFNYLVILEGSNTYLQKRTGNDIWKNLYQFPLIETGKRISEKQLMQLEEWQELFPVPPVIKKISEEYRHILSHQVLHARFIEVTVTKNSVLNEDFIKIAKKNLYKYAVPRLIEKYISASPGLSDY